MASDQMSLFGGGHERDPDASSSAISGVPPAEVSDAERALAARLPPRVHLGTSSWSFPGWRGLVYRDAHTERVLARRGLAAYAAHPLFGGVGLDRTFYAPLPANELAAYAAVVPETFRFVVKAHEALTLARYPQHARYGAQRGLQNPLLFDRAWASDQVIGPYCEGLAAKGGVLLFQFAPQPAELFDPAPRDNTHKSAPRRFAERLYRFLRDLPAGPRYAVEVRTPELLTPDYAACLRAAGAIPCLAIMPGLPSLQAQAERTDAGNANALMIRWLLAPHHDYESARAAYRPFNALVDPDPTTRGSIVQLIEAALRRNVPAFVVINNKAEGSSPLSVHALAAQLDAARSAT